MATDTDESGVSPEGSESLVESAQDTERVPSRKLDEETSVEQESESSELELDNLRNAAQKERQLREKAEKQLKAIQSQLSTVQEDARKELQTQLDTLNAELREASVKSKFYEQTQGKGIADHNAALVLAQQSGLIGDDGTADLDRLKEKYPFLFDAQSQKLHLPGPGITEKPPKENNANTWLREVL